MIKKDSREPHKLKKEVIKAIHINNLLFENI